MGAPYHQFCPVAKAMELLDERWTMLLLRELLLGTEHFNALRRGLPRMSPTLLSHRLDQLQRAGLLTRELAGRDVRYVLTPAGRELQPVVEQISLWGVRWIGELGEADLDPKLLLWDMHRRIDHRKVPPARTVLALEFPDARQRQQHWWLVIADGQVDVCDADPGFDVSVEVRCSLRAMVRFWRGDIEWPALLLTETARVFGPSHLLRSLPSWFLRPGYSGAPRSDVAAEAIRAG
jgi:DNA-binding HxlR family transcriptional regulator